jgi:hypothetical protein
MPRAVSVERTTLGLVLVLIALSGFVAGTTATFTAGTAHADNVVALASLAAPTGLSVAVDGAAVDLSWTPASAPDNAGGGTRVSVADLGRGSGSVPASCGSPSTWSQLLDTNASAWTDSALTTAPHANFTDGRLWCYRLQSIYPYPAGTRPWTSGAGNPTVPVAMGQTLIGGRLDGNGNGTLAAGDAFELWFNQPVDPAAYPAGYLCTDSASGRILVGVNSSTNAANCPKTTNPASSKDTLLTGFWLSGGTLGAAARWAISDVAAAACPAGAPEVCWAMRVTVGARTAGSDPTISGTWTVRGTANTAYLRSVGATRNFCAAGAAATVTGLTNTFQYRNNPTTGWCSTTVTTGF